MLRIRLGWFGSLLLVSFLALAVQTVRADSLVTNGGFETLIPGSYVQAADWAFGPQTFTLSDASYASAGGYAPEGSYYTALQGDNDVSHSYLSQEITGFTVGQQYTLTFDLSGWYHVTTGDVFEQGVVTATFSDPSGTAASQANTFISPAFDENSEVAQYGKVFVYDHWYTESWTFTANATTLQLTFTDPGISPEFPSSGPALDAVSIEGASPVPEPSTISLLLLSLAFAPLVRKR